MSEEPAGIDRRRVTTRSVVLILVAILLSMVVSATFNALTVRAVLLLVEEMRIDRVATAKVRERLIENQTRQAVQFDRLHGDMARIGASICRHMTPIERQHYACPD